MLSRVGCPMMLLGRWGFSMRTGGVPVFFAAPGAVGYAIPRTQVTSELVFA